MAIKLKKKFDIIFAREKRLANSVALQAIQPKPFSVWEVLIPIIFVLGFMRSREQREVFAQNLMFTKKMALEAAFEMLKNGQAKEAAMQRIAVETQSLLSTIPSGVYSDAIRQNQKSSNPRRTLQTKWISAEKITLHIDRTRQLS